MYNSLRSLRQISTWRSPQPAIICSFVFSSWLTITKGSDLESFLNPAINFGSSYGLLVLTETLTTGETVYFIILMLWASSTPLETIVAYFLMTSSTPIKATVLPQGTSVIGSSFPPIIRIVL